MKLKLNFFSISMIALSLSAVNAGAASVSATITCGNANVGVLANDMPPQLNLTYYPEDAGTPGIFWIGVLSPDKKTGAALTQSGWVAYQTGMYPYYQAYRGGLPGSISVSIPMPDGSLTTGSYVDYGVYVGHGAYTAQDQSKVAERRKLLAELKPKRLAAGTWSPIYDDDDRYIYSLVQKNMLDYVKHGLALTVPNMNCQRPVMPTTVETTIDPQAPLTAAQYQACAVTYREMAAADRADGGSIKQSTILAYQVCTRTTVN